MVVYPIAGLIPLVMSRVVKKRMEKEYLEEEEVVEDKDACEPTKLLYDDSLEIVDDPKK